MSTAAKTPVSVIQDLLAITRAVHCSRLAEGAPESELSKLDSAERDLLTSLRAAGDAHYLTAPAAQAAAERGLRSLAQALCRETASVHVFVSAWGRRLRGNG